VNVFVGNKIEVGITDTKDQFLDKIGIVYQKECDSILRFKRYTYSCLHKDHYGFLEPLDGH
jgi:hypothetical protein